MSFQQIILVGNVGRDPEIRYLQNGDAVCDFSVAVSKVTGKGETRKETTTWFKCTAFRNLAEISGQYVKKGMRVLIAGEVKASAYTAQNGEVRASLEVVANELRMLSNRNETGAEGGISGGDTGDAYNNNSAPAQARGAGGGNNNNAAASSGTGTRRPARGANEPTYTDPEDIPF